MVAISIVVVYAVKLTEMLGYVPTFMAAGHLTAAAEMAQDKRAFVVRWWLKHLMLRLRRCGRQMVRRAQWRSK
ncbi:hypothetical protein CHLRE_09g386742v5 [Chlamydomonas reinhardtii]|uniref:Uncharacterized protein n=1 Tax=Chlamydomonas reinhardtii TaxID=3055 RepID=A8J1V1_CHLRE|nr:uncharacterized protein CHLRE_09g386742v5 [Chlamydomonas reinhardtii]PNW78221.1 hypothetical protein CHLRE_09g386742v5 [Chlamydomonas reinhardtii]|eukprot:XP_001695269.1 predicted protein [Chlamydomonas reinhardtii]